MSSSQSPKHDQENSADFPALHGLGLDDDDLAELCRQGFLATECRAQHTYWKLRYRKNGRQTVVYVGGWERAQAIREELLRLQRDRLQRRQLTALSRTAKLALSAAKQAIEPVLEARGYHFHGHAIRRRRRGQK